MGVLGTGSKGLANAMLFILCAILGSTTALDITFCSPQNTGEGNGPTSAQFQSDGRCETTCKFQFAYAILQGSNCWCSNYAPYVQDNLGSCNQICPGFPTDLCGNEPAGLYGYYHLTIQPSGTLGAPQSSTSQTSSPSPAAPTTVTATVLATVTHSQPSTTPSPTTTSSSTSTPTPTPVTTSSQPGTTTLVGIVTTIQGSIQTVTVTSTIPPSAGETSASTVPAPDPFWSSTAKVAGTFTVVAIVLVLLLVLVGFFCWKRFRSNDSVAIRSVSDHDDRSTQGAAYFGGMTKRRHSRLGLSTSGLGQGPHDRSPPLTTPVSMSRRASQPMVHDQRLNPNALYAMGQEQGSRVSLESLQDDRDYSRPVLHVR